MEMQSTNMSLAKVQESAAVSVSAMGLKAMKEQAVEVNKLLQSSQPVTDPSMGRNINVLA